MNTLMEDEIKRWTAQSHAGPGDYPGEDHGLEGSNNRECIVQYRL